jgi:hypothetical protein
MTKAQARNKAQADAVKTIGGRRKYFACQKTKQAQPYGIWAFAPSRGSKNGHPL